MSFSEAAMAAVIAVSATAASYAACNPEVVAQRARTVAHRADCRAVDQAILAYVSVHDRTPRDVADLRPYVRGDISAYRIVAGSAAGPGCPVATPPR